MLKGAETRLCRNVRLAVHKFLVLGSLSFLGEFFLRYISISGPTKKKSFPPLVLIEDLGKHFFFALLFSSFLSLFFPSQTSLTGKTASTFGLFYFSPQSQTSGDPKSGKLFTEKIRNNEMNNGMRD